LSDGPKSWGVQGSYDDEPRNLNCVGW
jgi:hypothetical protein